MEKVQQNKAKEHTRVFTISKNKTYASKIKGASQEGVQESKEESKQKWYPELVNLGMKSNQEVGKEVRMKNSKE